MDPLDEILEAAGIPPKAPERRVLAERDGHRVVTDQPSLLARAFAAVDDDDSGVTIDEITRLRNRQFRAAMTAQASAFQRELVRELEATMWGGVLGERNRRFKITDTEVS